VSLIAAAVLWTLAPVAAAQAGLGALEGRVLDERSVPVAGATVSARNLTTGLRRSAVSSAAGRCRIGALPAGAYDVTAEASGFGTGLSSGLAVGESETGRIDFVLKAASRDGIEASVAQPAEPAREPRPRLQIYGFAALNLIYDVDQMNPDWFDMMRPSKLPSFANEFGENGNFWASVRPTRFGVRSWLPTGWGEVKTEFEIDLAGVGAEAGQTTFHLRQAWGELGAILAGQTFSVFMDKDIFPNIVEYWGPNGMVFYRNVQLRWTPIQGEKRLIFALERPGASGDAGEFKDRIELQGIKGRFPYPDFTAQYHYGEDWGHVQLAGIVRYIGWTDTLQDQFDLSGHAIGWGFNLSSVLKLSKTGRLRFEASYGEGIETYMRDAPIDVGVEENPGNPTRPVVGKALPVFGLSAFYDWNWSEKVTSAIGYSRIDIKNSDGQLPAAFKSGQYALANVLFTPVRNTLTGLELQWGRRQNFSDGFAVNDLRLQFTARYNFSFDVEAKP
jgi:hypothetical protein